MFYISLGTYCYISFLGCLLANMMQYGIAALNYAFMTATQCHIQKKCAMTRNAQNVLKY